MNYIKAFCTSNLGIKENHITTFIAGIFALKVLVMTTRMVEMIAVGNGCFVTIVIIRVIFMGSGSGLCQGSGCRSSPGSSSGAGSSSGSSLAFG